MLTSNPLHGPYKPGTVGPPLPGVDLRIDAPPGQPGGIEVRGANVFGGYWRRPEVTSTEFTPDGWFRTGDLGTVDADGYVEIVGRSKDMIITGGLNVYPKEVELVLDTIDGVVESAVIGIPDDDFGEAVVAVITVDGARPATAESVRAAARHHLAGFKVPKQVVIVDTLPRNAMGKVEKVRLRATLAPGMSSP